MVRISASSILEVLSALVIIGLIILLLQQVMNVAYMNQSHYPESLGIGYEEASKLEDENLIKSHQNTENDNSKQKLIQNENSQFIIRYEAN